MKVMMNWSLADGLEQKVDVYAKMEANTTKVTAYYLAVARQLMKMIQRNYKIGKSVFTAGLLLHLINQWHLKISSVPWEWKNGTPKQAKQIPAQMHKTVKLVAQVQLLAKHAHSVQLNLHHQHQQILLLQQIPYQHFLKIKIKHINHSSLTLLILNHLLDWPCQITINSAGAERMQLNLIQEPFVILSKEDLNLLDVMKNIRKEVSKHQDKEQSPQAQVIEVLLVLTSRERRQSSNLTVFGMTLLWSFHSKKHTLKKVIHSSYWLREEST